MNHYCKEGSMHQLFAFNLSEPVSPEPIDGTYDPEQQLWVGHDRWMAGNTRYSTSRTTKNAVKSYETTCLLFFCAQDETWEDITDVSADYMCDPTPGPC